jgi:AraC family transcriptional regulator of adaptative response/methylated-DNA-[protein]-cysteine methyltransferase
MYVQNRVTPFGETVAISQRGMFTGDRGVIHDLATKTLLNRRWAAKTWLVCSCEYTGRRRETRLNSTGGPSDSSALSHPSHESFLAANAQRYAEYAPLWRRIERRPFFNLKARNGSIAPSSAPISSTQTGSKEAKMPEIIRFAWATSSLGDFIVALSDKGLVTLEFSSHRSAAEDALRDRFREAEVIDSRTELADVLNKIRRAIEELGFDPCVPLDLRGTPSQVELWSMLRAIPVGEMTTYGALAAKLGTRDAREVTEAIACNPIAVLVPCHRVIKKDGPVSGYRWGFKRKRELLAREQRSGGLRSV